jgi:hypothetical protein
MKTQHTPGPWFAPEDELDFPGVVSDKLVICQEPSKGYTGRQASRYAWKVNARLIAAAPELLESLTKLLELYTETDFDVCGLDLPFVEQVKNLIAKATGEKEVQP